VNRAEALFGGCALGYGVLLHHVIPEKWHVPVNVAAALGSIAMARRAGASVSDCGVSSADLGAGLRTGGAAAAVVSGCILAAALPRPTRRLFAEDRITAHKPSRAVYEVLVRIPLGTAFSEEAIFRGAMLGVMLRRRPCQSAVVRASLWFGVWHVLPTLASLRSALLGKRFNGRVKAALAVSGVVGITAGAGTALAALRLRSRSVVAPVLAHAALNATAYLVARRAGRTEPSA
jgi:hypothetical protein